MTVSTPVASLGPVKGKRGRKQEQGEAPNKSRDVQRAFRERKAAELLNLYARIAVLEQENMELRTKYGEPARLAVTAVVSMMDDEPLLPKKDGIRVKMEREDEEDVDDGETLEEGQSRDAVMYGSVDDSALASHDHGAGRNSVDSPMSLWDIAQLQQQQEQQHRRSASILTSFVNDTLPSASSSSSMSNHNAAEANSPSALFPYARSDALPSPRASSGSHLRSPYFSAASPLSQIATCPLYYPSMNGTANGNADFGAQSPIATIALPSLAEEETFLASACGLIPVLVQRTPSEGMAGSREDGTAGEMRVYEDEAYARFCRRLMRGLEVTGKGRTGRDSWTTAEAKERKEKRDGRVKETEQCCGGLLDCEGPLFDDEDEEVLPAGYTSIEFAWRTLCRFSTHAAIKPLEPEELAVKILESGIVLDSLSIDSGLSPAIFPSSPLANIASTGALSNGGVGIYAGGVTLSDNIRCERTLGLIVVESVVQSVERRLNR